MPFINWGLHYRTSLSRIRSDHCYPLLIITIILKKTTDATVERMFISTVLGPTKSKNLLANYGISGFIVLLSEQAPLHHPLC